MRWTIFDVSHHNKHGRWVPYVTLKTLGVVTAKHQPDALLKAIKKFKITDNDAQHRLRAVREVRT